MPAAFARAQASRDMIPAALGTALNRLRPDSCTAAAILFKTIVQHPRKKTIFFGQDSKNPAGCRL
jgi:hypothetical protein